MNLREGEQREKTAEDIHDLYMTYEASTMPEEVIRILISHEKAMKDIERDPKLFEAKPAFHHSDAELELCEKTFKNWWGDPGAYKCSRKECFEAFKLAWNMRANRPTCTRCGDPITVGVCENCAGCDCDGWIKVSNRIPSENERTERLEVIVYRPKSRYPVQVETLHPESWKQEGKATGIPITHWMPMPKAPVVHHG